MEGLAASLVLIAGLLLVGGILTAVAAAAVMFVYRREDFPAREAPAAALARRPRTLSPR
jgi:hypothetical protein